MKVKSIFTENLDDYSKSTVTVFTADVDPVKLTTHNAITFYLKDLCEFEIVKNLTTMYNSKQRAEISMKTFPLDTTQVATMNMPEHPGDTPYLGSEEYL